MRNGPLAMGDEVKVSEWVHTDSGWSKVVEFFDEHEGGLPVVVQGYDQRGSRIIVASVQAEIVGILRLIVIPIGPESDLPAVKVNGRELLQAKIVNFFVLQGFRRRGIGVRLQEAAISLAKSLDCYQLVSFSYSDNAANHALKLSMGFAVRPEYRGKEKHGLYFTLPLYSDAAK